MMFHPIPMKCNGCEGSPPCLVPLEEEPLFVSDEVEEVRGSGPSGDARALEGKWLQSHQLQFPVPRQISLELVEDGKTLSEAHECDAHAHNWDAFCEDAEEAVHEHVLGVASSFFSGPPSSGSLHEDVAAVLEVPLQGCDGI